MFNYPYGDVPPPPPVRAPGKYNMSANIPASAMVAPANYTPPTPSVVTSTPESKTWLYVGLGVGALVLVGGAFLIFGEKS